MRTTQDLAEYGRALFDRGKFAEGEAVFDAIVAADPTDVHGLYGLATCQSMLGRNGAAISNLTRAIQLNPTVPEFWLQLGTCCKREQKYDVAKNCYEEGLRLAPGAPDLLAHMAGCFVNQGNPSPGIAHARTALKTAPEGSKAESLAWGHMALCLLESERWAEGWDAYEWRAKLPEYHVRSFGDVPQWDGQKVGTLALHAEQGLGDEILFCSMLPDVLKRADRVLLECNARVLETIQRSFPTIECHPTYGAMTGAIKAGAIKLDAWDRLASLGRLFRRQSADFPAIPYLEADPAKVAGYRARLQATGGPPYVGIAWKGGTKATQECYRRTPKPLWTRLVAGNGTFISLQYGDEASGEAADLGVPHWPLAINDLDEFAALTLACDLVVSVCQTAVHFAGALGAPCVVLTPSRPAWRYHLKRDRMLFYGSVRVARQVDADWLPAFRKAEDAIADIGLLQAAE